MVVCLSRSFESFSPRRLSYTRNALARAHTNQPNHLTANSIELNFDVSDIFITFFLAFRYGIDIASDGFLP